MRASTGEDAVVVNASVFCALVVISTSGFINFASFMLKIFCIHAAIGVLKKPGRQGAESAMPCLPGYCKLLSRGHCVCWSEDELGIAELPHLRDIETGEFSFCRDPVPDEELNGQVDDQAD